MKRLFVLAAIIMMVALAVPVLAQDGTDSTGSGPIVWSPDGSRVAYACEDGGTYVCIEFANAFGFGNHSRSVRQLSEHGTISWSPDGSRIAYACADGGSYVCIEFANAFGFGSHSRSRQTHHISSE